MSEREIFDAALAIADAVQRRDYLTRACGEDARLREHVEGLLQMQEQLGSFLESPVVGVPPEATVDQHPIRDPARVIGPYKLLEQIGEGGFGVVFLAEQTHPVRRKVALKVLKPGMDTRQVVARFEAERQALAIMDHPNIAKVFDGGATASGRPYFVMELVKGVPITDFCDQNHLTPRQRLELFVSVCQAVQHAHQKGVIHRDLKPSNVLVTVHDTTPVAKVIDFGVAKAMGQELTDKTLFTGIAQMVGTPLYMSPEQAGQSGLDVDTRSDVYALGVLLYELLTGGTPFSKERFRQAAYDEIRRIIREEDPPRPSTRLSESAATLPSISAQRHTEPAKLTRLVRGELDWIVMKALEKDRNRRYETANGFAADVQRYLADEAVQACPPSAGYRFRKFVRRNKAPLAFAGLVLLILLTVTAGIGWNVRDRAARRTAVEQEVKLALKEAEQLQEQGKCSEALSAAKRAEGLLTGGGSDALRDRVRQLRKDLDMVLRLEDIRLLLSEWKIDKFDHESADRAYAQAFADYGIDVAGLPADEAAARIRGRPGVAVALVAALDEWVFSRASSESKQVRASGQTLIALAQSADPDPWRRQVREAHGQKDGKRLAALAASPELLRQPPASLTVLAVALRARGDVATEIKVRRLAQRQYPGDFWINFELAYALDTPGSSYRDEAVSFLRGALAARPQSTAVLNNLGRALQDQGKVDEAIACYRRAIELDPRFRNAHGNLGDALTAKGKLDEAIAAFRTAIDLDPKDARVHIGLGHALYDQGKLDEAVAAYRKAIELDPKFAMGHFNLGNGLKAQGKLDEAVAAYRKAIELDPKFARAHFNLGNGLKAQGKLDEAAAEYTKVIELKPDAWEGWSGRAFVHFNRQQWDDAIADFSKAIDLAPQVHTNWWHRGHSYLQLAQWDKAAVNFGKVLERWPEGPEGWYLRAIAFAQLNQPDKAIADLRKAIANGFNNAEQLKNEPRFAPLHNREDFGKLLEEVERKEKSQD